MFSTFFAEISKIVPPFVLNAFSSFSEKGTGEKAAGKMSRENRKIRKINRFTWEAFCVFSVFKVIFAGDFNGFFPSVAGNSGGSFYKLSVCFKPIWFENLKKTGFF